MESENVRPDVAIRHLILCDSVHHNPMAPGRSYSLGGLVNWLRPEDEYGYPFIVERLLLFSQAWGNRGDFHIWIDLVYIDGEDEEFIKRRGPITLTLYENDFVESNYWSLHQIKFPKPGVYEFRVLRDEYELLGSVRVHLKEL